MGRDFWPSKAAPASLNGMVTTTSASNQQRPPPRKIPWTGILLGACRLATLPWRPIRLPTRCVRYAPGMLIRSEVGSSRARAAITARSAQSSRGLGFCRRSTATSWRSTSNPASQVPAGPGAARQAACRSPPGHHRTWSAPPYRPNLPRGSSTPYTSLTSRSNDQVRSSTFHPRAAASAMQAERSATPSRRIGGIVVPPPSHKDRRRMNTPDGDAPRGGR